KDMHKMMLSGETGTWAFVYVNFLNPFLTEQYDRIKLNPDETPIYLLPLRKGSWKGYDLYTPSTPRQQGSCIVISQGGLPWKPVSQETYLQYVRRFLQSQQKEQDASLAKSKEDARKQIEHIQNSPNLSPESKQTMLNALQKQQEQQQQTAASSRAAYINYFDQQLKTVDDYLAKTSPSVLQQPAFIPKYSKSIFDGNFSSEAAGGRMVVTANPDYTDHQLSSCRPQFMILFWKWEKDAPSQNFKQQFESDFPVEKLQAMLGDVAGKNNHPSKNTK
ncbi:MAG TPA: hypothetical protein VMI35_14260, partial [Puia sp.]|nr:hypothetical protein [Puia sp.]